MKNTTLFLVAAFVFVTIASCTTDDTALENETTTKVKPQEKINRINPSTGNPPTKG